MSELDEVPIRVFAGRDPEAAALVFGLLVDGYAGGFQPAYLGVNVVGRELDELGATTPDAIGAALGMPAAEATALLTRKQSREGDLLLLKAAAARLELQVPVLGPDPWRS